MRIAATAPMLPHISTANTARDMDRIRAALGGRRSPTWHLLRHLPRLGLHDAVPAPQHPDRPRQRDGSEGGGPSASRGFGEGVEDQVPGLREYLSEHPSTVSAPRWKGSGRSTSRSPRGWTRSRGRTASTANGSAR
ncbi:hypothetical protein LV779_16045 [Streptomyces thinghirensis]|nr:hypothetical protein [Streptomyces thinghirensis]